MGRKVCIASAVDRCKSNAVLSSRCLNYFKANEWEVTREFGDADLVLINTCGFHETLQTLSKESISRAYAGIRPGVKVISIGCMNKINRTALEVFPTLEIIPDLDALDGIIGAKVPMAEVTEFNFDETMFNRLGPAGFGSNVYLRWGGKFGRLLCRLLEGLPYPFLESSQLPRVLEELNYVDSDRRVYVEIGSGCVGTCSYCVIKRSRGPAKSRQAAEIIRDLKKAYKPGRVINFVADDCGSWGVDIGKTVFELVAEVSENFPGVPIDFCYINPFWFEKQGKEYVEMCATRNINSLNVSLQSGSDRIISAMNRHYKAANVVRVMEEIKAVSPKTMIWGHLMLNYPGETMGDLLRTVRAAAHFNYYMIFNYSPLRADQPAYKEPGLPMKALKWALIFGTQHVMMFLRLFFIPPSKPRPLPAKQQAA